MAAAAKRAVRVLDVPQCALTCLARNERGECLVLLPRVVQLPVTLAAARERAMSRVGAALDCATCGGLGSLEVSGTSPRAKRTGSMYPDSTGGLRTSRMRRTSRTCHMN